jgi:hypothetical protein
VVGAEEIRGEKDAPGLLQVATVELVLDGGQADVQDILLLRRKVLGQNTVITTLNQKKKITLSKPQYTHHREKGSLLLLRSSVMSKIN